MTKSNEISSRVRRRRFKQSSEVLVDNAKSNESLSMERKSREKSIRQ